MIKELKDKRPKISDGAYVAPTASVIGDVTVGEGSGVWFGAVVRGDSNRIRIGRRTNVQDLCILHVDGENQLSIGDDVTIGHRAILHGCTISDRVLIGMGAIVMNGAKVGSDSIIGAGALVTERTEIPPGSLAIGFPAKVRRALIEDETLAIKTSAVHYSENAALYKKSGI
jgi:carbonic anhydrase/acetyltransferase-like protein (isoleucine patch superfamily)